MTIKSASSTSATIWCIARSRRAPSRCISSVIKSVFGLLLREALGSQSLQTWTFGLGRPPQRADYAELNIPSSLAQAHGILLGQIMRTAKLCGFERILPGDGVLQERGFEELSECVTLPLTHLPSYFAVTVGSGGSHPSEKYAP